jgi:hypothetical protein
MPAPEQHPLPPISLPFPPPARNLCQLGYEHRHAGFRYPPWVRRENRPLRLPDPRPSRQWLSCTSECRCRRCRVHSSESSPRCCCWKERSLYSRGCWCCCRAGSASSSCCNTEGCSNSMRNAFLLALHARWQQLSRYLQNIAQSNPGYLWQQAHRCCRVTGAMKPHNRCTLLPTLS